MCVETRLLYGSWLVYCVYRGLFIVCSEARLLCVQRLIYCVHRGLFTMCAEACLLCVQRLVYCVCRGAFTVCTEARLLCVQKLVLTQIRGTRFYMAENGQKYRTHPVFFLLRDLLFYQKCMLKDPTLSSKSWIGKYVK